MAGGLSAEKALAMRMRRQGLAGRRARDVASATRTAAGLQAQDLTASRLAVRARSDGLDLAAVVRACEQDRTVVRTWLMRGTLHLVPAQDVRWLTALLGPGLVRAGRRRRTELGLTDAVCANALAALPDVLAGGPLTRAEVVGGLADRGVRFDPSGQAPAHLVGYAAVSGLVCRGPDRDREPTYVLLDDWVGPGGGPGGGPDGGGPDGGFDAEAALAELARRYLAAFSPASAEDFAAWSGLPPARARAGLSALGEQVTRTTVRGQPAFLLGTATEVPDTWRLLPAFDSYLLGYRSRELFLDPAFARRIQAGGGWIHPAVVRGGRVVGTWRLRRERGRATVAAKLFEPGGRTAAAALAEEAADVGRFLGMPAELDLAGG
jgi:hypothetical protein